MKYPNLFRIIFDLLFLMVFTLLLILYPWGAYHSGNNTNGNVHIKKNDGSFQLYRNGTPFHIKGASGNSHFEELANVGGNTIRVYDTLNLAQILENAHKNNLAVIVDIPLPEYDEEFPEYNNDDENEVRKKNVKNLVQKFKDHPALLIWNLGNEVRYPLKLIPNSFINTFNELIDIIHKEDPNHPVSTTVQRRMDILAIARHSSKIDLLGYNIFGPIKHMKERIESLNSLLSGSFPYFVSEWGIDGHWEAKYTKWGASIEPTSTKKKEQLKDRYNNYILTAGPDCQGSLVFYWGRKHECTYTWFNFFEDDDKTSEMVSTLDKLWTKKDKKRQDIGLEYMLLNTLGAQDNIILLPNTLVEAELKFNNKTNDSLLISWKLYPDFCRLESISDIIKNPKEVSDVIRAQDDFGITLKIPKDEGPYRLYAYVENQDGVVATCNTPFYVLKEIDE